MARQLKKFGAKIEEKPDGLIITGDSKFSGAEVDSETDHRVSMSLAIAALLAKGTSKISRKMHPMFHTLHSGKILRAL